MLTLGIVPDPKGREAHFQDFAYVLVLKEFRPSEELLVQKEKKYSLGTFSSGRRLHTIPYHTIYCMRIKTNCAISGPDIGFPKDYPWISRGLNIQI